MRKLVEITFMSLGGVIDAPDIVQEAQRYFLSNEEHASYQKGKLFAADSLLLGRKTYERLSKAYLNMAYSGEGVPVEFVDRMNSIPKYLASRTLKKASWNATIVQGDLAEEVRRLKNQPGKDIVKYGTGLLDLSSIWPEVGRFALHRYLPFRTWPRHAFVGGVRTRDASAFVRPETVRERYCRNGVHAPGNYLEGVKSNQTARFKEAGLPGMTVVRQ